MSKLSNKTIFSRAVRLAIEKGWNMFGWLEDPLIAEWEILKEEAEHSPSDVCILVTSDCGECPDGWDESTVEIFANDVIFNHDFAKAIWGDVDYWYRTDCSCGGVDFHIAGHDSHHPTCARVKAKRDYKFHLKQMVVEDEPLQYLWKNLK